jgi:hypothetical protein
MFIFFFIVPFFIILGDKSVEGWRPMLYNTWAEAGPVHTLMILQLAMALIVFWAVPHLSRAATTVGLEVFLVVFPTVLVFVGERIMGLGIRLCPYVGKKQLPWSTENLFLITAGAVATTESFRIVLQLSILDTPLLVVSCFIHTIFDMVAFL